MSLYNLSKQEINTILAALRFYRQQGMGVPFNRSDTIRDIATNGDTDISMDADGIDELCAAIKTGGRDARICQGDLIPGTDQLVAVIVTPDDIREVFDGYEFTDQAAERVLEENGSRISDAFLIDWQEVIRWTVDDHIELGDDITLIQ